MWRIALDRWSEVDPAALDADDLFSAAVAAHLTGRGETSEMLLERSFEAHAAVGHPDEAVRSAFFLVNLLMQRGAASQGVGWAAKAQRLAETLPPARPACESRGVVGFREGRVLS